MKLVGKQVSVLKAYGSYGRFLCSIIHHRIVRSTVVVVICKVFKVCFKCSISLTLLHNHISNSTVHDTKRRLAAE